MTTKLNPDSSLKREIRVPGIEGPVFVEITSLGLEFWVKGSRKRVKVGWLSVVLAGNTGQDVPSYLAGKPFELLKHYVERK